MVQSTYDPEKENFRFILEVEIDGEKQQKYWDTGSGKVAMVFDPLKSGDQVEITKNVDNPGTPKEKTNWQVEVLATEKAEAEPVKISESEEKTTSEDEVSPDDIPDDLGERKEEIEV